MASACCARPPNAGTPITSSGSGLLPRDLLQQLIEGLNREHLTAMLSHEIGSYPGVAIDFGSRGFLADTVIRLKRNADEPARPAQRLRSSKAAVRIMKPASIPCRFRMARAWKCSAGFRLLSTSIWRSPRPPPGAPSSVWRLWINFARRRNLRWIHHHGGGAFGSGKDRTWHADSAGGSAQADRSEDC